ncbi:MAG: hypothetical protein ACQER6_06820, partial [Pseudomonadota bacterium]
MNPVRPRLAGAALLARYLDWEALVTERCNRIHGVTPLRCSFSWASRLGDGVGWYLLAAAMLLLHGREAWLPMGLMLASGGLGVAIYLAIKRRTARLRPLHRNQRL